MDSKDLLNKRMVDINDFTIEKECKYKGEIYLVRDNGAVMRRTPEGKRARKLDNNWTYGTKNDKGYMMISSHRVHIIVATAFYGDYDSTKYVVDHIDTNRCNNRPENLRWLTRLENVLRNPVTVRKIIYSCGSLENFLSNPSAYRNQLSGNLNFNWMRSVTKEEANACKKRMLAWAQSDFPSKSNVTLGEWIFKDYAKNNYEYYKPQQQEKDILKMPSVYIKGIKIRGGNIPYQAFKDEEIIVREEEFAPLESEEEEIKPLDSLTQNAKQFWYTPTEFPLCPTDFPAQNLKAYYDALIPGSIFSKNVNASWKVVEKIWKNENVIVIKSETVDASIKPYALNFIFIKEGYYVHDCYRSFFEENGVDKYFALAQGKEWTGGEAVDDYC